MRWQSSSPCAFLLPRFFLPRCFALLLAVLGGGSVLAPAIRAENLNVDLGTHWGTPSASFGGAAGQPGTWNEVGLAGAVGLLDDTGTPTAVSMTVTALTDTGWTGTGSDDARAFVEDNIFTSGGGTWSVSLSGLASGAYDLYLYAPAHPSVASGDIASGTFWHPSIPGSFSGSFVEGTNVLRVSVLVTDGQLVVSSGLDTTMGLAGLQLVEVDYVAGFNIDLGTHWGPTADEHGAASGQTGPWNEVGLAGSAGLVDVIGRATTVALGVTAQTDAGSTGSGSTDATILLEDNVFTSGGGGWSLSFSGLADGDYDVYFYAPAHPSVPSGLLRVNGADQIEIPGTHSGSYVERVNYLRVPVTISGGALLTLAGLGDGLTGLAGVQIVPVREPPSLNIDLGVRHGVPDAAFAAAGVAGEWQRLSLGTHAGLRDVNGSLGATSVKVTAGADTGYFSGAVTDAELLLDDDVWSSGATPWSIEITGLPRGWYEVILYAPSHTAIPSGPMTVGGVDIGEIPGDAGSALVEGTSWTSVLVRPTDGRIDIAGGGVSSSGLAGLQLIPTYRPLVPMSGPLAVSVLALGLAALGFRSLRRR